MNLRIKEDSEIILEQKTTYAEAIKNKKALEKNIYNLEKKIDNMNNKIDTLQTSKKDLKMEKDNLTREVKRLQKISVQFKGSKSATTTQKEPESNNNNLPPEPALRSIETSQWNNHDFVSQRYFGLRGRPSAYAILERWGT